MALPSSGTISVLQVAQMFGGSTPHSLSEYYKGGSRVFTTDTVPNVPTSGTISLSNFHGSEIVESYVATVTAGTTRSNEYNSFPSTVTLAVNTDGDIVGTGSFSSFTKEWLTGTPRSVYQVRFTKMSDTTSGTGSSEILGTLGSWVDLNAEISMTATADNGVNLTRTITVKVEVRRLVDSIVVSTTNTNVLTMIAHSNVGAPP
jgi:hypothetical protein